MNVFDALPPLPKPEIIRQFLPGRMLPSAELCDLIEDYGRQCFEAGRNAAFVEPAPTTTEPAAYRIEHRAGRYVFCEAMHWGGNKSLYPGARVQALLLGRVVQEPERESCVIDRNESIAARPAPESAPYFHWCKTLIKALKRLSFAAQTMSGTAGRDEWLMASIAEAEHALSMTAASEAIDKAVAIDADHDAVDAARLAADGGVLEGWNRTTSGTIGQP